MKKLHTSLLAFFLLLFSVSGYAAQISATNDSGYTGSTVNLHVSFDSGSLSFGGDFLVSFDSNKLALSDVLNDADPADTDFQLLHFPGLSVGEEVLSLTNNLFQDYFGPIFTLQFVILATGPDSTTVTVSDYDGFWATTIGDELTGANPIVTVLAPNGGTVPEPGALGLVGLALLLMSFGGRRNRVSNDDRV